MARMDDDTLKAILGHYQAQSNSYFGATVADRQKNLDYYYGELFGNEDEEHSKVVLSDVQDAIETIMPDLLEIFAGNQTIVQFEPQNPEDEDAAEQTGDLCKFIWSRDNKGYQISHDWIKDALIMRLGVIKVYFDDTPEERVYYQTGLDAVAVQQLMDDPEIEILEQEESEQGVERIQEGVGNPAAAGAVPAPGAPPGNALPQSITLYNLKLKRTRKQGRVRIVNVPPEEYLTVPLARDEDEAPYQAHRRRVTFSELKEMGYDPEKIEGSSGSNEYDLDFERINRFQNEMGWIGGEDGPGMDQSMRTIWLYENYIKVDYDGDGIAELRRVVTAGNTIFENDEIQAAPFVCITPIRMPHKLIGRAVVDLVKDIQLIRSTVTRQMLDNMYRINNNRAAINERVDIDDWLSNRAGGYVRVRGEEPASNAVFPIQPQPIGGIVIPMLEFFNGEKETRIGVTRYNQGSDAGSLNKTATGIQSILGRAQKRIIFIARTIAETGYVRAYGKIRDLLVEHQQESRTVRLRNKWVRIDPRSWNADMDVQVHVALGTGTREQLAAQMMSAFPVIQSVIALQGGLEGPLFKWEHIHNMMTLWLSAAGVKNDEAYVADPQLMIEQGWQPPQRPDPAMAKVQAETQLAQMKAQADAHIAQQKAATDGQLMTAKAQHEMTLAERKAEFEMAMKKLEMDNQARMAEMDMGHKARLAETEMAHKMSVGEQDAKHMMDMRRAKMQSEGVVTAPGEDIKGLGDILVEAIQQQAEATKEVIGALTDVVQQISKPRMTRLMRGKDGRATHAVSEVMQ